MRVAQTFVHNEEVWIPFLVVLADPSQQEANTRILNDKSN